MKKNCKSIEIQTCKTQLMSKLWRASFLFFLFYFFFFFFTSPSSFAEAAVK
jgi:hypothetical protein